MTKRIRSLFWTLATLSAFGTGAGCSCDPSIDACPDGEAAWTDPATGISECVPYDDTQVCTYEQLQTTGGFCPMGSERFDETTGTWDCGTNGDACEVVDLEPGYMAQYLDTVTVPVGTDGEMVAISGYSPGWLDPTGGIVPFGDLVYAEFTPGGPSEVEFEILDGKPENSEDTVAYAPDSWRDGNNGPGDDVGMYSSIATNAAGDIYIAYSDFTMMGMGSSATRAYKLKLAHRLAAETEFTITTIDETEVVDNGGAFYPSLVFDPVAMVPVVAYGVRVKAAAAGAQPTGFIRVATASSATPTGPQDWVTAELTDTTADIGCRDGEGLCADGDRCFAAGTSGRGYCASIDTDCQKPDGSGPLTCTGEFGTVSLCVNDACQNVKVGGDLVDTVGISNNLFVTATGLGLVYHDRGAGQKTGTACETAAQCPGGLTGPQFCSGVVTTGMRCSLDSERTCTVTADCTVNSTNYGTCGFDNDGVCMIPNGNLWGLRSAGGTWSARFLIDGYSRKLPTVGDSGQHATVALDSTGAWHLAYLDGTFDRIRYARVANGANTAVGYAIIDDGNADNVTTTRPADRVDGRRRLVGGEISIAVTPSNQIRVLYQDITGMTNSDPTVAPPGAQPLVAISANAGALWNVRYATAEPVTNGGYWTSQSLGILATSTENSYCTWVERTSSPNDGSPDAALVPDSATTHVVSCATP